jgi:hypothetical protein
MYYTAPPAKFTWQAFRTGVPTKWGANLLFSVGARSQVPHWRTGGETAPPAWRRKVDFGLAGWMDASGWLERWLAGLTGPGWDLAWVGTVASSHRISSLPGKAPYTPSPPPSSPLSPKWPPSPAPSPAAATPPPRRSRSVCPLPPRPSPTEKSHLRAPEHPPQIAPTKSAIRRALDGAALGPQRGRRLAARGEGARRWDGGRRRRRSDALLTHRRPFSSTR